MIIKTFLAIILPIALIGCASNSVGNVAAGELTSAGQQVEVVKFIPENKNCKYVGDVNGTGSSMWGFPTIETAQKNARAAFRNNAADIGGNVAVLDSVVADGHGLTVSLSGSAYHCVK